MDKYTSAFFINYIDGVSFRNKIKKKKKKHVRQNQHKNIKNEIKTRNKH